MRNILIWICILGLLGISETSQAALQTGGERPADYLLFGVGGREVAMGQSGIADPSGLAAAFLNPALITSVRTLQVDGQYDFLSLNRQLGYFAIGNHIHRSSISFGLSAIYFSAGNDLEYRLGPSYNPISTFGDTEMTFLLSLGTQVLPNWTMGVNLKYFFQSIFNVGGWGGGIDFGTQWKVAALTRVAAVVQDAFSILQFPGSSSGIFPPTYQVGISQQIPDWNLIGDGDLVWSSDLQFQPRVGVEWKPWPELALRGGYGNSGVTGGFGILLQGSTTSEAFDYTLFPDAIEPGNMLYQINLSLKFL